MIEHKPFVFTFADVEVREREFCIVKAGEVLPVEPKAFRVLLFLLHNPHKLVKKDDLLDAVWNDCAVSENSLTRSIALLRKLLPRYEREGKAYLTICIGCTGGKHRSVTIAERLATELQDHGDVVVELDQWRYDR